MKTKKSCFTFVLIMAELFLSGTDVLSQQTADQLYEKALYLEEAKGDMQGAIDLYQQIIKQYPGSRQIVAKALLHEGFCYEKLGLKEAQQVYRILSAVEHPGEEFDKSLNQKLMSQMMEMAPTILGNLTVINR